MVTAGADGCSAGWVCAVRDRPASLRLAVFATFSELLAALPAATIAVDMPIGLADSGARDCDLLARQKLGPRRGSVFPAPIRPCMTAESHAEASATRRLLDAKGMSIQTWNIVPKIREVDCLLSASMQDRVFEAHPELAFAAMNGRTPCFCSKKTVLGKEARQAMLVANLPLASSLFDGKRPSGVGVDDLLDAMAILWTADRRVVGKAERLPADPPSDRHGLRMEIWY